MAGLLGMMAAGAAKGYSQGRGQELQQQKEFDLKTALMDAQMDKELRLREAGYEMDDKREQARKDKVAGIANSVVDPMDDKGGYEPEEAKEKRERGLLKLKADKLADAGEFDAAKVYYGRSDAADKTEMSMAQLELKEQQILATIENQKERNRIQEELGDAKNATQLAKLEAAVAKSNSGGNHKPTDSDNDYASYVGQMKSAGKKPMARYQFNNWMESKKAGLKSDLNIQTVTEEPALDNLDKPIIKDGKPVMTRKVTRKEEVPKKPTGGLAKDKNGNYIFSR